WEEIGLLALRPSLDEQAVAIAENQEGSLVSRKTLAAQAKAFRALVEKDQGVGSEIRSASGPLVRAFKAEIDALTARSRFAEGVFLVLYRLLREAPDPAVAVKSILSASRAAIGTLEERCRCVHIPGRFRQWNTSLENNSPDLASVDVCIR
ncbi:unnamed protein product, partial [Discosporangium mesarthrocarpum]